MAKVAHGKKHGGWQNRIVGHGEAPANSFLAHELNARRHPAFQREVLRGSLNSIGWIDPVIVSERSGKLLDGHAWIEEALSRDEAAPVPFVSVNVTEEEEKLILASLDPIAGLAIYDQQAEAELLREIETEDAALDAFLSGRMAELELAQASSVGSDRDGRESLKKGATATVKVVLACRDLAVVEKAIRATGVMNRGEAMMAICEAYLDAEGQLDIFTEDEPESLAA